MARAALPVLALATVLPGLGLAPAARAAPDFVGSDPIASDDDQWAEPGFRFSLGYGYSLVHGLSGVPDAHRHALVLRAGARLDASWSLLASLRYGADAGDFYGLGFAITVDPTWHIGRHLEVAVGLGVGGLVGGGLTNEDTLFQPTAEAVDETFDPYAERPSSLTLPDARTPLPSCDGRGLAAVVRVGWRQALSDIWSLAVVLEGEATRLACEIEGYEVDPATAEAPVVRQWWTLVGASLGLELGWR